MINRDYLQRYDQDQLNTMQAYIDTYNKAKNHEPLNEDEVRMLKELCMAHVFDRDSMRDDDSYGLFTSSTSDQAYEYFDKIQENLIQCQVCNLNGWYWGN